MSDLIKIAVDAMGGDGSPKKVIDGIIHNHNKSKKNFFKIFGDQDQIEKLIKLSKFLEDFSKIENLVVYFDDFNQNLSKKSLNFFLKGVSNL